MQVLRMSEHGDGDGSGVTMATNLGLDFSQLHMRSWVYWQVREGRGPRSLTACSLTGWLTD